MTDAGSTSVFQTKYEEYAKELLEVFPEFAAQVQAGLALSPSGSTAFRQRLKPLDPRILRQILVAFSLVSRLVMTFGRRSLNLHRRLFGSIFASYPCVAF